MADDQAAQAGPGGTGPLYERGVAGQKAAEEPVQIPGSDDPQAGSDHPTGDNPPA